MLLTAISTLQEKKTRLFCGTGTQQKTSGTSGRVQATPNSPRAKEGAKTLPSCPRVSPRFRHSCRQRGRDLRCVWQDTTQEKPFSQGQREHRGWGAPVLSQSPGEGEKKSNKEHLVLREIPAGGGWIELNCGLGEVSTKPAGAWPALLVNGCR